MGSCARQALASLQCRFSEQAVTSPELPQAVSQWAGTCVGIAGVPLLVGDGELEEIVETPAVTAIPGTKPWVMGVGSHMGGLLPVISGDIFFRRRPYAGRVRDFCMVIRRPGFYFGMTLSDVERDMKLPLEALDTQHPVEQDFADFTVGGFEQGGRFLAILDIEKLISDSDLSDAAAIRENSSEGVNDEQAD